MSLFIPISMASGFQLGVIMHSGFPLSRCSDSLGRKRSATLFILDQSIMASSSSQHAEPVNVVVPPTSRGDGGGGDGLATGVVGPTASCCCW